MNIIKLSKTLTLAALTPLFTTGLIHAQNFGNIRLHVSDDSPRIGREMTLTARMPTLDSAWRYTFLYRFDDETRWTVILDRVPAGETRWTPRKGGNLELRVDAVAPGRDEMRHTVRTHVRTGQEGVNMNGRFSGTPGSFPAYPEKVGIHIDKPNGMPGEARQVMVRLSEARNGRRITFMVRHQSDSAWRILRENSDALSFRWTPDRVGQYQVRVDTGGGTAEERAQITFTCLDPSAPAGVRMRGR